MSKTTQELFYIFIGVLIGLFIGFIFFWTCHIIYPNFYHEAPEVVVPWSPKSIETDLPVGEKGAKIKYGYLLITKTSDQIGLLAKDSSRRYAGNNLSCNNCHLNAGRKIGSGSFVGVADRFPQFRGRENKEGTLEERINGCMERSMNGRILPEDSEEMKAMIAYMNWLSEDVPPETEKLYKGYVKIKIPDFPANPIVGKKLYQIHCEQCHMDDGRGVKIPPEDQFSGYIYPPLSGHDTFNDGAGMNRVLTAAQFIKGNMPFGAKHDLPLVSDEEAYHLAAYINTFERPLKVNKEADFPDKTLKPVSTPYGPWVDDFPAKQHKFGPFPPIIAFYKEQFNLVKTK
jgi:thiosulfate dehydrogenase